MPIYGLISTSITFGLVVSFIDIVNVVFGMICGMHIEKGIICQKQQIMGLICLGGILGFIEGIVFAFMGIEDLDGRELLKVLDKEEKILVPLALIIGVIGGLVITLLKRDYEGDDEIVIIKGFKPLSQEEEI